MQNCLVLLIIDLVVNKFQTFLPACDTNNETTSTGIDVFIF